MATINLAVKLKDTEGKAYADSAASWLKRIIADRLSDKETDFLASYSIVEKINASPDNVDFDEAQKSVIKKAIEQFRQLNPINGQPLVNDYMKAQLFLLIDKK